MSGLPKVKMSGPSYRTRHDAGPPDEEPTRTEPRGVDATDPRPPRDAGAGRRAPGPDRAAGRAAVPRVQGTRRGGPGLEEARTPERAPPVGRVARRGGAARARALRGLRADARPGEA